MRLLVGPRIQEEQCGFCPGCGTLDQLFTLARVLEGTWELSIKVSQIFQYIE